MVERQRAFFEYGPEHLKILRMCDLAAEFGCDPSTISRTVDDKYMQTPRGIFPLRYFFTGGTETDQGDAVSRDAVKARVQQMVETEGKNKPLSDDQLAKMLQKEGINVSRRTIAKYRSQSEYPLGAAAERILAPFQIQCSVRSTPANTAGVALGNNTLGRGWYLCEDNIPHPRLGVVPFAAPDGGSE